jgi:hypothetical protein
MLTTFCVSPDLSGPGDSGGPMVFPATSANPWPTLAGFLNGHESGVIIATSVAQPAIASWIDSKLPAPCSSSTSVEAYGWGRSKAVDHVLTSTADSRGYVSAEGNSNPTREECVDLDLGKSAFRHSVTLYPATPWDGGPAGWGFPTQFIIEVSNDPTFATNTRWWTQATDLANPGTQPVTFGRSSAYQFRYVRLISTKMRETRPGQYQLGLAELSAG